MSSWGAMALLTGVLLIAAIMDWRTGRVVNRLTYPAMLLGIGWAVLGGWIDLGAAGAAGGLQAALLGLGAGLLPFYVIFTAGGLGGGDAKLMGAVGAISADWRCVLAAAVYAFFIAFVMAVVVMIRRGLVKRTAARLFGAALMTSAKVRPDLSHDSPRIPFAVAICLGGILAGAEVLLGVNTPWAAFRSS